MVHHTAVTWLIYHSLIVDTWVVSSLGLLRTKAYKHIHIQIFSDYVNKFLLHIYLGIEFLGQGAIAVIFNSSITIWLLFIYSSSLWHCLFLHILFIYADVNVPLWQLQWHHIRESTIACFSPSPVSWEGFIVSCWALCIVSDCRYPEWWFSL